MMLAGEQVVLILMGLSTTWARAITMDTCHPFCLVAYGEPVMHHLGCPNGADIAEALLRSLYSFPVDALHLPVGPLEATT